MKIICLSCGNKVDLGDAYDDYAGLVKCVACGMLLQIQTEAGNIRAVNCVPESASIAPQGNVAHRRSQRSQSTPQD